MLVFVLKLDECTSGFFCHLSVTDNGCFWRGNEYQGGSILGDFQNQSICEIFVFSKSQHENLRVNPRHVNFQD
jgi:hypothetical protein